MLWSASIFSQSGLSFNFINAVFQKAEVLYFDEVQFIKFVLLWVMLVSYLRKLHLIPNHRDYLLMFSYIILMVLGFTFRYIIHFDLIFVCGAKCGSKFTFFSCGELYPVIPAPVVETIILSSLNCLCILVKISCLYVWVCFGLCFVPLTYLPFSAPVTHSFNYCSLIKSFEIG